MELQREGCNRVIPSWMADPLRCGQMSCGIEPHCSLASLIRLVTLLQALEL